MTKSKHPFVLIPVDIVGEVISKWQSKSPSAYALIDSCWEAFVSLLIVLMIASGNCNCHFKAILSSDEDSLIKHIPFGYEFASYPFGFWERMSVSVSLIILSCWSLVARTVNFLPMPIKKL